MIDVSLPYKPDEGQLATELAKEWNGKMAFFYSEWWEYEHGVWLQRNMLQVREHIRIYLSTQQAKRDIGVTANKIKGIEAILRGMCYVPDEKINPRADYLNVSNGLLNLKTFHMEPHRPDLYFTWQLNVKYTAFAPRPETFIRYLRTSIVDEQGQPDKNMILLLQEALGYILTPDTSKRVSFWLKGESMSGKSQLLGIIREILKPMHGTINLNKIGESRFLLAAAAGKRVVTFSEADEGSVLPDGLFKTLVGGNDEIQVEEKNKPAFTFIPQCKVVWAMNTPPRVLDRTDAVYNRIIFILFPRAIPKHQQIDNILELMMRESEGILWWMVEGLRRLREQGFFTKADRSVRALTDYRLYNDEEAQFIQLCKRDANHFIAARIFQSVYKGWRKENGYAPKSERTVKRDFERHGVIWRHDEKGNWYYGLQIPESFIREYSNVSE